MNYSMAECDALVKATYGKGINPNPLAMECAEWQRQLAVRHTLELIADKIVSLFEPRFITPPETSACIGAIVTMTDARKILEVGTCTGFTALHILRSIIGKPGAHLTSIDCRPAHDPEFFALPEIAPYFTHIIGTTPGCFASLVGHDFDLVFIDSDHGLEHTKSEIEALVPLTHKGSIFLFHDLPEWPRPDDPHPPPVRLYVESLVTSGFFKGSILPTARQLDCVSMWGPDYPPQCSPHLGVFVRT